MIGSSHKSKIIGEKLKRKYNGGGLILKEREGKRNKRMRLKERDEEDK